VGIATLIAAGRLDDRLVERALGLLRELDPGADFAGWIDDGDAADLLVPFMFGIWQGTVRTEAVTESFTIGIRVSGRNAGDYRVTLSREGLTYEQGEIDSLPARIEFDAGSLVLTAFGRGNFGTVRGDMDLAERYLNLFFHI
jgi:hypothetical protein